MGEQSLTSSTTGYANVALGFRAGLNITTGNRNSLLGGSNSNYVGGALTTGVANTLIGTDAGKLITTGTGHICIGDSAGMTTTTSAYNIFIGFGSVASNSTTNHELVLGTYDTTGKGSNTGFINPNSGGVYQGNNSSSWSTTSDERLKKNIVDNNEGLSIIDQVRVRNFEYRTADEITELQASDAIERSGTQLGVIAQELEVVAPRCVKTESTGVKTVDSDELFWHMLNSIKELSAKVAELEAKIGD